MMHSRCGTHGVTSTAANLLLQADIVVLATGYTPLAKTLLPTEDLRVRLVPMALSSCCRHQPCLKTRACLTASCQPRASCSAQLAPCLLCRRMSGGWLLPPGLNTQPGPSIHAQGALFLSFLCRRAPALQRTAAAAATTMSCSGCTGEPVL